MCSLPEANARGTWGYIEMVAELEWQMASAGLPPFDVLYFSCGSGGTAAGLALAMHLCKESVAKQVVAIAVDDDPDTFYNKLDNTIFPNLLQEGAPPLPAAKTMLTIENLEGNIGYAKSTPDERAFIVEVAKATGVILDPVYTGKGAKGMRDDMKKRGLTSDSRVLFVHTGGMLGSYAKADDLKDTMKAVQHIPDGSGTGWEAL